jgi:hypothetical protein
MTTRLIDRIRNLRPCPDAVEWLSERDLVSAWVECPQGDWMLWLAARAGVDRRAVVQAACDCAEPAMRHLPAGEQRPAEAIRLARAWARGQATLAEVRRAADAAVYYGVYYADDADDASVYAASLAAAHAATYAYAASPDYAADAAASAADADAADAEDAAAVASLARRAGIVRARVSWQMVDAALAKQKERR